MSQITVENIKRSTETASRSTRGVAAAWVNFNGTGTVAVRDSENVSSLTDNGTGDYTVNIGNDFAATDFACLSGGNTSQSAWNRNVSSFPVNASSAQVISFFTHTDVKYDFIVVCVSTFGDLA